MTSSSPIPLPHRFTRRPYQEDYARRVLAGEIRRGVKIWHRRAGKDKDDWNTLIQAAGDPACPIYRVGTYYYIFPTYTQGKKALWDAIDADGFRVLDHCPAELTAKRNDSELKITLTNGSVIQVVGSDNVDSLVGTNPVGIVFSEYSLQSPLVWQFLQPILVENNGWALFNFTPRGANHAQDLYEAAREHPETWQTSLLTVDDTRVLSAQQLAEARAGMSEEVFRQEFYCDFEAGNEGSYYGRLLATAKDEGRIGRVPVDPGLPVHTSWDLGVGDATAIWFFQVVGRERRHVDYYESSGEGLPHYIHHLQSKQYIYGRHFAPHDIEVREWGNGGVSRIETARQLGIRFEVIPQHTLEDGIEATRLLLPRCWFDSERCKDGIAALRAYHKAFDDKRQTWRDRPEHDWSSHAADAFRYGAMAAIEAALPTFAAPAPYRAEYLG
jgi:phage terminase large subunit